MTPLDLSSLPDSPISRLAPTPSGFLHLGNAVNFLITWALVRKRGGRLHLRIDDMDGLRFRNEVLEDIFASLKWLGLDWDEGPQDAQSFYKRFSLQKRKEHYRSELKRLGKASGRVFACPCSRSAIKKVSQNGLYPGTCRRADRPFVPGETALRVEVPQGTHIWVGRESLSLDRELGDFVLWRKDDEPSYQLASLIEDEQAGVNLIVRGEDLAHSTAAQLYLADLFGFFSFFRCSFLHHGLILGEDGEKLSKSRGAYSLKEMREAGKEPLLALRAAALALGLDPQ
ncbi:MAG: glutamate--tRNA ligase family protein, partial [Desulfobacterales bacterium]|nr:glutamate--tRNA ligase family protein [Desulfobacterales bacterium]